jgi:hypothetical protein
LTSGALACVAAAFVSQCLADAAFTVGNGGALGFGVLYKAVFFT